MDIHVEKSGKVNTERLDEELKAALAQKYRAVSVKTRGGSSVVTIHVDDAITQDEERTARGVVEAHREATLSENQAMLKAIRDTAAGAAGVALVDLTAGQIKALLACLLYKAGGVARDGKVAPLDEWMG